jgi:glycerol-3-phosphate acyltransferase PlsY
MFHIPLLLILLSYLLGCFSTARLVAKWAKSLNIYRVGTGHADSENIYENVSHPLA